MSDLDRLELFTYVAQAESITQAAMQLNIAKAALSKQIQRLERDLKIDLFSRQGQRLTLTESGKIFLHQCLRVKKELDDVRALSQEFHEEPTGQLHIATIGFFARTLIIPRLNAFLERYPKLEVFLNMHEQLPNFEADQIDLAVGFSVSAPLEMVRRQMAVKNYVLCASPEYFKKHGKPQTLKELQQHFYMAHNIRIQAGQIIYLKTPHKISLKPSLLINSIDTLIECAVKGIGITQLPENFITNYLHQGQLITVLDQYQAKNVPVYYYYPKYRYTQPKVRKFIDFFLPSTIADSEENSF